MKLVSSIKEKDSTVSFLSAIAQAYSKLGDSQKGQQTLSQALKITNSIENEYSKASSLSLIAQAYGKLGDSQKEKQVLLQALKIARSIEREDIKVGVLSTIVQASSNLGGSQKGRQRQVLSQALELANSIENKYGKAISLSEIAQSYFDLGDRDQAKTLLDDVVRVIDASSNQSFSLLDSKMALLYAEFGNWGEALHLAQRCYHEDKIAVFVRILQVHAEQQQPEFKALRDWQEEEEEE